MSIYQKRLTDVRQFLAQKQLDAVVITSTAQRRWLSGFTGSAGMAIVSADDAILATDGRYWLQAQQESADFSVFKLQGAESALALWQTLPHLRRIAFEADIVTVATLRNWQKTPNKEWVELNGLAEWRERKSADEIEAIARAAAITDSVMARVPALVRLGMTERQLAWELEKGVRELGADGLAFETIVASGENGGKPHHHPSDRPIQAGDGLTIDMGARLNGYHSDLTRTFFIGESFREPFATLYHTVLAAQENALHNMKAGMSGAQIDALARSIIVAAGYGDAFSHSLGHGVGLEIHEGPRLSTINERGIVPVGAVVTVEPGIYLPSVGGVRIEDLVVMLPDGIRFLSHCPKSPLIPL